MSIPGGGGGSRISWGRAVSAVIGVPDEIFQEIGWAFIMLQPGKTATEEESRTSAGRNWRIKDPQEILHPPPAFLFLASGKVNKMALKAEMPEKTKTRDTSHIYACQCPGLLKDING